MNATAPFLVFAILVLATSLPAQQFRTNHVSQAQAIEIASQLRWGMTEKEAVDFLEAKGLRDHASVGVPPTHWTTFYLLSNGCRLDLEIEGGQVVRQWKPGQDVLKSASIVSNTSTIAFINLTNRLQPEGGANGKQPLGSETNRTTGAAASRRSP